MAELMEWRGTRGGGWGKIIGELAKGRFNVGLGGNFCVGGTRGGWGEFGTWSVSPSAVPRVSEEASRSAFRLREPCAGPNVCGVQCDRDRSVVSVPPFFLLN